MTAVDPSISSLIPELLEIIDKDPHHALPPLYRQRVYEATWPLSNPQGQSVYSWHAVIAAEKVLSIWLAAMPYDVEPAHQLEVAKAFIREEIDTDAARYENRYTGKRFKVLYHIDETAEWKHTVAPSVYFAGVAAWRALYDCAEVVDSSFNQLDYNEYTTDADIKCGRYDTALWASLSVAGHVGEPDSNKEARREFWHWWLTTALQLAWNAS